MTTTPTQVVQSMYAAFGRGDVEGLLGLCTNDVDWTMLGSIDLPYIGQFQGQQALLRWFGLVAEFDDIQAFEPREFFAGADHVTVLGWERTRAKPGQGVFETPWVHLFSVRDGKVARFVGMYDTAAVEVARRKA
ncbi:ketosteroid isomerase-like protein [Pelomonas saccharophila]|uniref:Ketosteroid isomerase-like protein n=1 Tax=Roseateles saccharophilus TaxID=304 RepID=A0ABU1YK13_ROSSA|nr:nuclear transport factor 2 family protein [Roseateles saccharophilus]MDR7269206.1 ketosteroid isomerase-like protein [Roseateles saccharophilus]